MDAGSDFTPFCKNCAAVNWESVFEDIPWNGRTVRYIRDMYPECPMCGLILSICPNFSNPSLELTASTEQSATLKAEDRFQKHGNVFLSVQPGYGYLSMASDEYAHLDSRAWFAQSVNQYRIDLYALNYWLKFCEDSHPQCRVQKATSCPHSKLIDCRTKHIVKALPEYEYIALSYVWGDTSSNAFWEAVEKDRSDSESPIPLPNHIPMVIADAITFVNYIKKRYLWVDQYCINQIDNTEKAKEIRQMDLVYTGAWLTIFAAAGPDANYGLPGIGKTQRINQPRLELDKGDLISTHRDPKLVIGESRWMSRGWTFQEGEFSRRRLFFTDEQMYYECSGMFCQESIHTPLEDLPPKHFVARLFSDVLRKSTESRNPKSDLQKSIEVYNVRQLTYETDALNAFRGLLRFFESAETPLYHCWAVPCKIPNTSSSVVDDFAHYLLWKFDGQIKRRPDFPSWSWLGWSGKISLPVSDNPHPSDAKFWLKLADGTIKPLETINDGMILTQSLDQLSPHLHIKATCIPIRITEPPMLESERQSSLNPMQRKLESLQGVLWEQYLSWYGEYTRSRNTSTCNCDGQSYRYTDNAGGYRTPMGNYFRVKDIQFPLKSKDGTCLVHSPQAQKYWLVLLQRNELTSSKALYSSMSATPKYVPDKHPSGQDLSFLFVQAQEPQAEAERIGIVRVHEGRMTAKDLKVWGQIRTKYMTDVRLR
ncbi:heterokaryon incompatibility protein-domain-containing protein [Leptodontidium sp. 2 PMI_412]|nr:heterokaryon incompatibility protein-domain-containing protein [Leptodontidium sp. 2 PMI_412]